jgi:Dolichyl-phosphate-mannose-protein mannosyltransferase
LANSFRRTRETAPARSQMHSPDEATAENVEAMTSAAFRLRALSLFERLADALLDPARRERVMAALLVGYAVVWSLYGVLAKGSQDIHFDMGEMFAWSREPALGTPKHPPLAAWVVGLWFSVMPRTDWTYYLLAMMMPTLALWIVWRLSADYLDVEKRVAGVAVLTLIPFMNFHALKYNANTILIPLWAATTFWFLRSFESRPQAPCWANTGRPVSSQDWAWRRSWTVEEAPISAHQRHG